MPFASLSTVQCELTLPLPKKTPGGDVSVVSYATVARLSPAPNSRMPKIGAAHCMGRRDATPEPLERARSTIVIFLECAVQVSFARETGHGFLRRRRVAPNPARAVPNSASEAGSGT